MPKQHSIIRDIFINPEYYSDIAYSKPLSISKSGEVFL